MSTPSAPSAPRGLFISLEGIDGAGKSTHIAPLAQAFAASGRQVLCSREPGGTPLAESLRQLVLHEKMDALTEALLVFAARRDHLQQVIAPALAEGQVVLCDRFADATFAYQGGGRGFDWQTLLTLEQMVLAQTSPQPAAGAPTGQGGAAQAAALQEPDLTLWFDLPAATAAARLSGARQPDKFEAESAQFFENVQRGYARRADENPQRFVRIDAAQSVDAVREQVFAAIRAKGWL
ncbi:MAG: dTMP kinase [Brachymonas sp.]|nr:dTMP kinase [Brachymonas sp.]MDO4795664.1 dTMP kinase [Brachymonas sp.]